MIHGIDVSNWQSARFPLDLPDTGKPIDFVIIQVTRGLDGRNERWREQAAWARENGLAVGFYHFGKPGDAEGQARRFNAELTATNSDALYPGETLWYDWESSTSGTPTNAEKDQFITALKTLRPGRKVGLYCNVDFWKNRDVTGYHGDALWIASWSDPVADPDIQAKWTIHQYAYGPGVDHDRADFSDREAMKVWGGKPEDPTMAILREIRGLVREIRPYLGAQAEVASARFDSLKATLDIIQVDVAELTPDPAPSAVDVIDELARRLES